MSTPFTTAAAPLNAEKTMTRTTGTPSTNVPTAKIAPTIRRDDHGDEAGPQAQPLEEADPERIADGAAEDDDRRVVPEERDRREDDPEDETDAPRQDRREDAALAEHLRAPLRPGHETEEERPQRQQDREQLQPVERPGETDADGQQADDDRLK